MKNQLENQAKLVRGQLDILSLNILNLEAEVKQINSKINETDAFINHTAKYSNSEGNSDHNNTLLTERVSSEYNNFLEICIQIFKLETEIPKTVYGK